MLSVLMSSEPAAASQRCPGAREKDGCWIPRAEPFLPLPEGSGCSVTGGRRESKATRRSAMVKSQWKSPGHWERGAASVSSCPPPAPKVAVAGRRHSSREKLLLWLGNSPLWMRRVLPAVGLHTGLSPSSRCFPTARGRYT